MPLNYSSKIPYDFKILNINPDEIITIDNKLFVVIDRANKKISAINKDGKLAWEKSNENTSIYSPSRIIKKNENEILVTQYLSSKDSTITIGTNPVYLARVKLNYFRLTTINFESGKSEEPKLITFIDSSQYGNISSFNTFMENGDIISLAIHYKSYGVFSVAQHNGSNLFQKIYTHIFENSIGKEGKIFVENLQDRLVYKFRDFQYGFYKATLNKIDFPYSVTGGNFSYSEIIENDIIWAYQKPKSIYYCAKGSHFSHVVKTFNLPETNTINGILFHEKEFLFLGSFVPNTEKEEKPLIILALYDSNSGFQFTTNQPGYTIKNGIISQDGKTLSVIGTFRPFLNSTAEQTFFEKIDLQ